jgi:aryl-alcohol dehydrogenase-like predicted oxidoreductase
MGSFIRSGKIQIEPEPRASGTQWIRMDADLIAMKRITLPNTNLVVSQLAYGTASYDGTFPDADGLKLFAKYLESGGNFIDTAHCYCFWVPGGEGASERFVAKAVREFGRDGLVIATKGGHIGMNGYPRPDSFLDPVLVDKDFAESLERLGLPSVDIYYLHRDDPRVPAEEIIESLNDHVKAGRTRYLGASNWSVARTLTANAHAVRNGLQPFVVLQNQWSLAQPNPFDITSPGAIRYIERSELEALEANQIPVVPFSPTANGYFATDGARGGHYESPENRRRLLAVQALAAKHGATTNQIALAYLINQPFPVIPILGTLNLDHLEDAIGAPSIELTTDELRLLDS